MLEAPPGFEPGMEVLQLSALRCHSRRFTKGLPNRQLGCAAKAVLTPNQCRRKPLNCRGLLLVRKRGFEPPLSCENKLLRLAQDLDTGEFPCILVTRPRQERTRTSAVHGVFRTGFAHHQWQHFAD